MFIEPDEHVIIMEDTSLLPFSSDDLRKLEDGGVRTIFVTNIICWNKIYSGGDWSTIDSKIDKFEKTNLKLIIPFHGKDLPPKFKWNNDAWLSQRPSFTRWADYSSFAPDYSNPEYVQAVDNFADELFKRYSDRKIQFIFAIPDDGEFPFFPHWNEWPIPIETMLKFIHGRQEVLSKQYGEIWTNYHNQTGCWNAKYVPLMYETLRKEFPNIPYYAVQFEHFTLGVPSQVFIKKHTEEHGIRFFVGSNYVEGLRDNLKAGIEQKTWGFLTAPLHRCNPVKHTHVEDWMISIIQKANERLCEAHK